MHEVSTNRWVGMVHRLIYRRTLEYLPSLGIVACSLLHLVCGGCVFAFSGCSELKSSTNHTAHQWVCSGKQD